MRLSSGTLLVVAWLGTPSTAVDGQSPPSAVEELLKHQLAADGRWRQDNPAFEPGSEGPAYWVRLLTWGPARHVVVADAFSVSARGQCEPVAHLVYFWDAPNARVGIMGFNAGGVRGEGYLEATGPTETLLFSSILLPNGDTLRIRERSDYGQPEAYETHAERLIDSVWVAEDPVTWLRDPDPGPCG